VCCSVTLSFTKTV